MAELGRQINTEQAKVFDALVSAGWANLSDGNVEAPTGHFALVHVEPNELDELASVIDDDSVTIYPGSYIIEVDSDGNKTLIEYLTLDNALEVFNRQQREFALWDAMCPKCDNEGPHSRLNGNVFLCVCGEKWDPTDGLTVDALRNRPLDTARRLS